MAIWFASDWHFCHDREFVWKERGFNSVDEMNGAIVERHNSLVKDEDIVYVLGDLMLMDNKKGMELFNKMNGQFYIIRGNHDTNARLELYKTHPRVKEITWMKDLKVGKLMLMLSHWPLVVANEGYNPVYNLHGHTHQKEKYSDLGNHNYHVGMDTHNCYPTSLDKIIEDLSQQKIIPF